MVRELWVHNDTAVGDKHHHIEHSNEREEARGEGRGRDLEVGGEENEEEEGCQGQQGC